MIKTLALEFGDIITVCSIPGPGYVYIDTKESVREIIKHKKIRQISLDMDI